MTLYPAQDRDSNYRDPSLSDLTRVTGESPLDYGAINQIKANFSLGFSNNITGTTVRWLGSAGRRATDHLTDAEPASREYFDDSPAPIVGVNYRGQSKSTLDWEISQKLKQIQIQREADAGDRPIRSTVAAFGGGFTDPLGFLLPAGQLGKAKLFQRAGYYDQATRLATWQTFKTNMAYNTLLEAPYASMRLDMGDEYNEEMLAMSLGLNPVFSGAFAGLRGFSFHRQNKVLKRAENADAQFKSWMDGQRQAFDEQKASVYQNENGQQVITGVGEDSLQDMFKRVYESNNVFANIIDSNPRLKDIMEGRVKEKDFTLQDNVDIAALMHMRELHTKLNSISRKLANDYLDGLHSDSKLNVGKAYNDYNARVARITKAIISGDFSKLKDSDIAWLRDNEGVIIRRGDEDIPSAKDGVVVEEGVGLITEGAQQANVVRMQQESLLGRPKDITEIINDFDVNGRNVVDKYHSLVLRPGSTSGDPRSWFDDPENPRSDEISKGVGTISRLAQDLDEDLWAQSYRSLMERYLHPIVIKFVEKYALKHKLRYSDPGLWMKMFNDKAFLKEVDKAFKKQFKLSIRQLEREYKKVRKNKDSVFPEHRNTVNEARKAVNDIFLGGKESQIFFPTIPKVTRLLETVMSPRGEFAIPGANTDSWYGVIWAQSQRMGINDAEFFADYAWDGNMVRYKGKVFFTMAHEWIHQLQWLAPEHFRRLLEITKRGELGKRLDTEILNRGYGEADVIKAIEHPSTFLEYSMTRPEFWKVLEEADSELYGQFASYMKKFVDEMAQVLREERPGFIIEMASTKNIDKFVEDFAVSLVKIREEFSVKNLFKDYNDKKASLENYKKGTLMLENFGIEEGNMVRTKDGGLEVPKLIESKMQPAYKNPNLKVRAARQDAYNADPSGYLEDVINKTLGNEEILPILVTIPKNITKQLGRKEHIARVEEDLTNLGYRHIAFRYQDILTNLQASRKRLKGSLKSFTGEFSQEDIANLVDAGMSDEQLARVGFIYLNEGLSNAEKIGAVTKYFQEEDLAMILRVVHDETQKLGLVQFVKTVGKGKKTQLAQLKTVLDGNQRAGVQRGTSIQRRIEGQIQKDQAPLFHYLAEHDLLNIFLGEDVTKYMSQYFKGYVGNAQMQKIYNTDLEEASDFFHRDIMTALMTGEMPAKFKGIDVFENLVELVKTTLRGQLAEINNFGVNVRESKNFTGYNHTYSREVVTDMGLGIFVEYMMKAVDLDATYKAHGGYMKNTKGDYVAFVPRSFFVNMHKSIVDGTFVDDGVLANKSIVGAMRKSAKVIFKPEYKIDALIKFSNFKNLGRLMLDQIRSRSEKIALVKNLGHDPYGQLMKIKGELSLARTPGVKTFDMTAKQITGGLDNPVDVIIAQNFQKVRQVSNIINLAGSGMSTLSDIPLTLSTLQYLGVEFSFNDFIQTYKNAIDMQFKGNNKEMAAWFRSQGAGFDLITRTMAQRVLTGEPITGGRIAVGSQIMFEVNGSLRATATHQTIFLDYLTSALAAELKKPDPSSTLIARLKEFGLTDKEISSLKKYIEETPDGIERLAPSSIVNEKLQGKMQGFYLQYMKEAVLEPDVGAQAITRLGLEAGTYGGETVRVALQYSSFMLGMGRVVYRRFMHGYQGEGKHNAFILSHLVAYLGMAMAFAYMTTVLKDLSKFKEPINLLNMSQFDFNRIISQSGILSIGDLGFNAMRFGDPTALFSPIVGQALGVVTGDGEEAFEAMTGQNYPIIGPVIQKAIGFVMGETINSIQSDMESYVLNLNDKQLDNMIKANELAGYLKMVNTPDGGQIMATTAQAAIMVEEKKRRMALDTE